VTLKQLAENYLGPPPEHSDMVREEDNEELQRSYRKEVERLVGFGLLVIENLRDEQG
jgi:hypothetical protein